MHFKSLFSKSPASLKINYTQLRKATNFASSELFFESDGTGNYFKLALPIKKVDKEETTAFVIHGHEKVSDLIKSINREQQNTEGNTFLLNLDGDRISGSTDVSSLFLTNFQLQLNKQNYKVESRVSSDGAILRPDQLSTITTLLQAQQEDTLPLSSFLERTRKEGISDTSVKIGLRVLSRAGKILYNPKDTELRETIFLNPTVVASSIEKSLLSSSFRIPFREKVLQLTALQKEMKELDEIREACFRSADRTSHAIATAGFVFISCQFLLYARLTWWDSDWDVMEPITWFTGVVEMVVGGFAYYLFKGSEFGHMGFRNGLLAWRLKSLYQKRGFSQEKYDNISRKIAELETQIKLQSNQPSYSHKE